MRIIKEKDCRKWRKRRNKWREGKKWSESTK
jgi:hypothetical protein